MRRFSHRPLKSVSEPQPPETIDSMLGFPDGVGVHEQ